MKNKKPVIRFKGFSEDWEENELFNLIDLRGGRDYKHLLNGDIPVYGTGGYMLSVNEALSYNENAIGIGRKGTIDKPYILEAPFWTVDTLFYSIPKEKNNLDFFYDIFQRINWRQKNEATGVPSLSKVAINGIHVFIPKPLEQTQIGNFFKNLDTLITLHQRKYDKLGTVKKAMLEKMFPKNGADVPEIRFKGFGGAWEVKTLGGIADFSKGQGYSKNDLVEVGSQIILYGRLYTKYQTVISEVDTYALHKNGSTLSKGNEVIVPSSGESAEDIARASAVVKSGIILGGDLNIIYPNDKINCIFLALTISHGKPQKELAKKAQGKSVVHLRNADLKEVKINYPIIAEQNKICKYFQNLDNLLTLHKGELEKLKNIKKAMLERMFV